MMKGYWQMVFQQWKEAKQLLDRIVLSMMEGEKNEVLLIMAFQQQRRTSKQVLDGVVSAIKIVRKWRGWEEMKNDEQWCFSIETMMKGCWQSVFQQWEGKNETSAGRSCFGNKNGGELAD
jgi:hypothetical protein